ncbi:MAG: ATP-dependent zinc metalloprotease FtsH [candidate division TM6 bacterium GW2011_GWE2_41_16]|nr:MAG: ATP-dependent zinc metalloprotease FtsH [candidate division TM6 bacterium GW2011_GWE2_41_16]
MNIRALFLCTCLTVPQTALYTNPGVNTFFSRLLRTKKTAPAIVPVSTSKKIFGLACNKKMIPAYALCAAAATATAIHVYHTKTSDNSVPEQFYTDQKNRSDQPTDIHAPTTEHYSSSLNLSLFAILDKKTSQLQGNISMLSQLVGNAQNHACSFIKKRNPVHLKALVERFGIINAHLEEIRSDKETARSTQALYEYIQKLEGQSDILADSLKKGLIDLPLDVFELSAFHAPEQGSLTRQASADQLLEQVDKHLNTIENILKTTGLSWINKTARFIRIQNKRLSITNKTVTILATVALFSAATVMLGDKSKIVQKLHLTPFQKASTRAWKYMFSLVLDQTKETTLKDWFALGFATLSGIKAYSDIDASYGISARLGEYTNKAKNWLYGISSDTDSLKDDALTQHPNLDDPFFDQLTSQTKPLRDLLEYLKNPDAFIRSGITVPKGILFTGASGNGKTFTVKAFCASINQMYRQEGRSELVKFKEIPVKDLFTTGVGTILEQARQDAPCVIFIDEIHLLKVQVEGNGYILADLLKALDDVNKNNDPQKQIIIIAATNRPDLLDVALKRPGRFDQVIQCNYPTTDQRKHLLEVLCKKTATPTKYIDFDEFALFTEGCSFSMINKLFNIALYNARTQNSAVTQQHLYDALRSEVWHVIPTCTLSDQEKKRCSAYQAGMVLGWYLYPDNDHIGSGDHLAEVTLQQYLPPMRESYWFEKTDQQKNLYKVRTGKMFTTNSGSPECRVRAQPRDVCRLLCGSCAEKLVTGLESSYGEEDHTKAFALLNEMKNINGVATVDVLSENAQNKMKDEAYQELARYQQQVNLMLAPHKQAIELIQKALLESPTLTLRKAELDKLFTQAKAEIQ